MQFFKPRSEKGIQEEGKYDKIDKKRIRAVEGFDSEDP